MNIDLHKPDVVWPLFQAQLVDLSNWVGCTRNRHYNALAEKEEVTNEHNDGWQNHLTVA